MDAYENLANAIILQAVKDYRRVRHLAEDNPVKREVKQFFCSEWFGTLTNLDPKLLLQKIEEE